MTKAACRPVLRNPRVLGILVAHVMHLPPSLPLLATVALAWRHRAELHRRA